MNIGFIGLGIMGKPMAMNLMKAGFKLTVYNRTGAKCGPLVDAGAAAVRSPREAAECSDVVVTVVSDCLGRGGRLLDALKPRAQNTPE